MYNQYTTQYETEVGSLKIERTYKTNVDGTQSLDSLIVNVSGCEFELPKSMHQTDRTIVRKVCSMIKTMGVSK